MWPSDFQFGRLSFGGEIFWVLRVFYLNRSLSLLPSRLSLLISLDKLYQFLLFSFHAMTNLFTWQDSNGEGMTMLSLQPCTNSVCPHIPSSILPFHFIPCNMLFPTLMCVCVCICVPMNIPKLLCTCSLFG